MTQGKRIDAQRALRSDPLLPTPLVDDLEVGYRIGVGACGQAGARAWLGTLGQPSSGIQARARPTVRSDRRGLLWYFRRRIFEKWLCFVKKVLSSPAATALPVATKRYRN